MGPEWILVGIVAIGVIFGAKKLPEMARSVGRAQGEFKKGLKQGAIPDPEPEAEADKPAGDSPAPDA
jgi:sec-independent protein translocase protein TatA